MLIGVPKPPPQTVKVFSPSRVHRQCVTFARRQLNYRQARRRLRRRSGCSLVDRAHGPSANLYRPLLYWVMVRDQSSRKKLIPERVTAA